MNLMNIFHHSWQPILPLLHQEPLLKLNTEILPNILYYPAKENIFRVFKMPLEDIKVVILGQDPYYGVGQANGLCFAVNSDVPIPPSLKIIFDEIRRESNNDPFTERDLEHWEEQGVFLLNTALTVESGNPGSHLEYWSHFIKNVVNFISVKNPCIWMLWGLKAQSLALNMAPSNIIPASRYSWENLQQIPISPNYNYVLKSAHPAAEARKSGAGFLGNNHFLFANTILSKQGKKTINW